MAERKSGAGARLSGVLERSTPTLHSSTPDADEPEQAVEAGQGQGKAGGPKKPKSPATVKRTGRTIYLGDDLFERIIVQAHRRGRTISEYVAGILERQVPDHRVIRAKDTEPSESDAA
jgi:hypothetical protein